MCHNVEMDLEGAGCGKEGARFSSTMTACVKAEDFENAMIILWLDNCGE
jgi:hypothetical protein